MTPTYEASRRMRAEVVYLPAYRGEFNVYTPCPDGGSYVIGVTCRHTHKTPEQATACAAKGARFVERNGTCPDWLDDQGQIARTNEAAARS